MKKALELARTQKIIGSSQDAKVTLYAKGELYDFIRSVEGELATVFIVSQLSVCEEGQGEVASEEVEGLSVTVAHADGEKCPRCWSWSHTVGADPEHPQVCARCAAALRG